MTKECINCGYKWKLSKWEKIKLNLWFKKTNKITYTCPECGAKTELIRRYVFLEALRDV